MRKIITDIGGGGSFLNPSAKKIENILVDAVNCLKDDLSVLYPDITFEHKPKITKMDIALKVNPLCKYSPQNSKSFIKPDGGILFAIKDGKEYPILISETKKQGTNDARMGEGKKKQPMGNAIERSYKNIEEFKLYCSGLNYFPYIIFACGCDFHEGSSILDRLDAMTKYEPRNVSYVKEKDQKVSIFLNEDMFTYHDIYSKIKKAAIDAISCILEIK